MSRSAIFTFTDPAPYGAAIRAAETEVWVTSRGNFRAELIQIDLGRLWLQQGRENLPRIFHTALSPKRAPISFFTRSSKASVYHAGVEVSSGDIIVNGSGATYHRRTSGPCEWASMSLTPEHLADAGRAILGRDVAAPSLGRVTRPAAALTERLSSLHMQAAQLAKAAPEALAHPETSRALEQSLVHAMMACLCDVASGDAGSRWRHHSAIMMRFEELLAANSDRPMYLTDICAATGASERTLRVCCEEHLGMGPIKYLWLRRMHLARRAIVLADPAQATVTRIASDHGFWELGRFAVAYRALFGESPSASLRRPSGDPLTV
jgi:AraC-like DNA-binding protein